MIIGSETIKRCIDEEIWKVYRTNKAGKEVQIYTNDLHINPNSVDVTLGHYILTVNKNKSLHALEYIDLSKEPDSSCYKTEKVDISGGYLLCPHEPILGFANERFDTPSSPVTNHKGIAQCYEGRSTMARIFIQSHMTAGFGDVGFHSNFTFEIVNFLNMPIMLYPNIRIGQIFFQMVYGDYLEYEGSYQNQQLPQVPKLQHSNIY